MLRYTPSYLVSAALLVSNEMFARSSAWTQTMAQQTGHSDSAVRCGADELRSTCEQAPTNKLQVVPENIICLQLDLYP